MKIPELVEHIGNPVAYYPKLVKLAGSPEAVIFLCQMAYWLGKQEDKSGWIYKTTAQLEGETGLSPKVQRRVRNGLKNKGYLQERYEKSSDRFYFYVEWEKINTEYQAYIESHPDSLPSQTVKPPAGDTLKSQPSQAERPMGSQPSIIYSIEYSESTQREKSSKPQSGLPLNGQADEFVRKWNAFATKHGLPSVVKLTDKRRCALKRRLAEGLDFERVLSEAEKQSFLLGDNQRGWVMTFDFIIERKDAWVKILEHAYQRKEPLPALLPYHAPDTVRLVSPDGQKFGYVHKDAIDKYLCEGYKVLPDEREMPTRNETIRLVSPEGKIGSVAKASLQRYLDAGYRIYEDEKIPSRSA